MVNKATSTAYEILKLIPTDPSENYRANYDNPEFKNLYFNTNRAAFHQPINTLTQTGAQLKNFGGQYHPLENRTFTLNELKRLTSLPDDFKLSGSFNQRAERIGRMVPPLLTKHLVENIYNKVLKTL
jgi:DNA (cytosine-5)-methyltransferase 1